MTVAVTAIICTYNRYDCLPKAVESLLKQEPNSPPHEIVVVDNSPDYDYSKRFSKQFSSIKNLSWIIERKSGLSNARNVGLSSAKGAIVAYMDDDAIAKSDWLMQISATYEKFGQNAFAVGGKVIPIWAAPKPAWLDKRLECYVSAVDWGGTVREVSDAEWIVGTNISFRTDELRNIGGFSVGLGRNKGGQALLSNEESEVTEKLKANGGSVLYAPDVELQHLVEVERLTQSWFRRRMVWQATSDYLKDSVKFFDNTSGHWWGVTDYFSRVPPAERTPSGFFFEKPDADSFYAQLSALYNFQICMLAGFYGLDRSQL